MSRTSRTLTHGITQVGLISILTGVALFLLLPDSPAVSMSASSSNDDAYFEVLTQTCWFLNERQRQVAVERMNRAQTGVKNTQLKWPQVREALTDWRVWLIVLQMLFCQAVGAVQSNFLGIIIKGLGYTALNAQLLTAPNFAVQVCSAPLRVHRFRLNACFAYSSSRAFWSASLRLISNVSRI